MKPTSEIEQVLSTACSTGGDFAELFFEDRNDTIIKDIASMINGVTSLHIKGVGLYVLKGTASVYVYGNDTTYGGLMQLARKAAELLPHAQASTSQKQIVWTDRKIPTPCPVKILPGQVDAGRKIQVVRDMELAARKAGPRVAEMNVEYYDNVQNIEIFNTEGLHTGDTRTFSRIRMAGTVTWQDKGLFSFHDLVKPQGFETFLENDYIGFAENTVQSMENQLKAKPIKSGVMPVVFAAGPCGVFWHEACGHNLEATAAESGCFAGKKGQMIASEKVTLIDDGTVPGLCGSEAMDDEGTPTQKNVLIDHGKMVLQLADRKGGRKLGTGSTGSGRRQSYTFAPAARMHNTYLAAGEDDDDEMIRSIDKGLYVTEMGGGSSGENFSVAVTYGYMIRNGELAEPVSGVSLSGTSTELIKRVDRVGKTLELDYGGGFCGAASGLVQTTCYEPRFRISSMNVGGTEA